jgi:DNA-binding IclR family transcriptional regulator
MADKQDTSLSSTVVRGLKIITCFDGQTVSLSNAELSERLDVSRPTVARLCKSLVQEGFLVRTQNGRFQLGISILKLAYPILARMPWRQRALPYMRDLASSIGGAVSLATISGNDLVFVQTVRDNEAMTHVPEIGMSAPLPIAAMGRALLSLLPRTQLESKIAQGMTQYPDLWAQYGQKAQDGIRECQERGYCVALGDWRREFYGAGAPIKRLDDGFCIAINCGVPDYRVTAEQFTNEIAPRLASVARLIHSECISS